MDRTNTAHTWGSNEDYKRARAGRLNALRLVEEGPPGDGAEILSFADGARERGGLALTPSQRSTVLSEYIEHGQAMSHEELVGHVRHFRMTMHNGVGIVVPFPPARR